jgi:hypothetical protein
VLGGTVATIGGVVADADERVGATVVSTLLAVPAGFLDTSRTADTRMARVAIPIAARAAMAAVVRYQGGGG